MIVTVTTTTTVAATIASPALLALIVMLTLLALLLQQEIAGASEHPLFQRLQAVLRVATVPLALTCAVAMFVRVLERLS